MEINKRHILSPIKNEQDAIKEIEAIKLEKENPISTSESGYNVEFTNANENVDLNQTGSERLNNNRIK